MEQINKKLISILESDETTKILNNAYKMQDVVFPKKEDVFKPFSFFEFKELKVVIFGQDPYYQPGVADGLAFSSQQAKTPASLKNIFKQIKNEYPNTIFKTNSLISWAKQGVLLLNTCLTVIENAPLSHKDIGWDQFILKIIKLINEELSGVVFVLWGSHAKKLTNYIDINKHFILTSAHPSPFSFEKGFWNNGHFKKINEILKKQNKREISWDTY